MDNNKKLPDETPQEWVKRVAKKDSAWLEKAQWRRENRYWLRISQNIALSILSHIREDDSNKEEVRLKLEMSEEEFSSILSGKENLTIMTIAKIERVLGEKLIIVPSGELCRMCDTNPVGYDEQICVRCIKNLKHD